MRVADWIGKRLKREADVIFGVTGGCIVNCVDGFHKQGLRVIPMHHEQAAAMAADGYARMTGRLGLCFATSGPGGQNLLTGIASAYYDGIPVLAIIGQVPYAQVKKSIETDDLRQFGFQETLNHLLIDGVAKVSIMPFDEQQVQDCIEKAIWVAFHRRMGPSVVEICDNFQRADFNPTIFDDDKECVVSSLPSTYHFLTKLSAEFGAAKHPVLILGAGVTRAGVREKVEAFLEGFKLPILLSWGAKDLLDEQHPCYCGGFGVTAERAGNYALKHADLIVSIGCRLDTHSFGNDYSWLTGKTVMVADIDQAELDKLPDCCSKFNFDIKDLFSQCLHFGSDFSGWAEAIKKVRRAFPIVSAERIFADGWGPYGSIRSLSNAAPSNAIVIGDAGQSLCWLFQAWETKKGQTLFSDFNNSCMGWSLPASIGAAFACPDRPVYCVIGDGSLMMNLQELQTIKNFGLNIRIIVMDNAGYGMIMQTQRDWPDALAFGVGCNQENGLTLPDFGKIANAFGIDYLECESIHDIGRIVGGSYVDDSLFLNPTEAQNFHRRSNRRPILIRIPIHEGSRLEPKTKFGNDLWNQHPYLTDAQVKWIDDTLGAA